MRISGQVTAARAWPAALFAAFLLASPAAYGQAEPPAKEDTDICQDTLEKEYGVIDVPYINHKNTKHRNSVYADGKLANGQTVRFRCLFNERAVPEIQAYVDYGYGSPNPGRQWGSADAFFVPEDQRPKPPEPEEEVAAKPVDPDAGAPDGDAGAPDDEAGAPDDGAAAPEGESTDAADGEEAAPEGETDQAEAPEGETPESVPSRPGFKRVPSATGS